MGWTEDRVTDIYYSTNGYCHICDKKLSLQNYGQYGERGAWHVDHVKPRALGGDDRPRNLRPACIDCNLEKGHETRRQLYDQRSAVVRSGSSGREAESPSFMVTSLATVGRVLKAAGYSRKRVKSVKIEALRFTVTLRKPKR